jgi:stage III sporulation protein AD
MVQIAMAAMIGSFLVMELKNLKPEYGQILLMALGVFLLYFAAEKLQVIVGLFQNLAERIALQKTYVFILLKIIGIAYICEFAANLCKDAGCQTIASQVEMIGKLSILFVSTPVITALADTITQLLE